MTAAPAINSVPDFPEVLFFRAGTTLVNPVPEPQVIQTLATAARTCYHKQTIPSTPEENQKLLQKIYQKNHLSVFEHAHIQAQIFCDRGVSHELVRHRIGVSFLQESTRYTRYRKACCFILPHWFVSPVPQNPRDEKTLELYAPAERQFLTHCVTCADTYAKLLDAGLPPQDARAVLPNATATNIFLTANFREVFHILNLRMNSAAHPDMQKLMENFYLSLTSFYSFIFQTLYPSA